MTIYYFTISVIAGLGFILTDKKKEKKKTVIYIILSFLILVFTASFRYAIGFDYFSYKNIYETISGLEFNDILNYYWKEPLFFILCKLFCILGCPYHLFLVFLNIFLISAVLWFVFNYSKIPWTSIYFYITLQFLAYNMNLLRQSVALTFFLFAYPFLKDKKIVPYTILIITGGMFHNTLLLLLPFYFLLTKKNTKKYTLLVILLSVLIYYFFDPFFSLIMPMLPEKYADYFDGYFWKPSTYVYVIPSALYCILIYLFRKRIRGDIQRSLYINSAIYNFIINLFITKHFILERFSVYPFAISLIAIPEIIYSYRRKGKKQTTSYYCVLILFILYGIAYFLFATYKGFHNVYPYISLLDKSHSSPVN